MRTRFSTPPQSIFVEIVQRQTGDARALRAVLAAARLLGLACGVRLTRVATRGESTALIGELRLALARAEQEIALLTERLERIAARHRRNTRRLKSLAARSASVKTSTVPSGRRRSTAPGRRRPGPASRASASAGPIPGTPPSPRRAARPSPSHRAAPVDRGCPSIASACPKNSPASAIRGAMLDWTHVDGRIAR
jgi:hypothetical protein